MLIAPEAHVFQTAQTLGADSGQTLLLIGLFRIDRIAIAVVTDKVGCQRDAALLYLLIEDGKNLRSNVRQPKFAFLQVYLMTYLIL